MLKPVVNELLGCRPETSGGRMDWFHKLPGFDDEQPGKAHEGRIKGADAH
jgi:hypothetical protein